MSSFTSNPATFSNTEDFSATQSQTMTLLIDGKVVHTAPTTSKSSATLKLPTKSSTASKPRTNSADVVNADGTIVPKKPTSTKRSWSQEVSTSPSVTPSRATITDLIRAVFC